MKSRRATRQLFAANPQAKALFDFGRKGKSSVPEIALILHNITKQNKTERMHIAPAPS